MLTEKEITAKVDQIIPLLHGIPINDAKYILKEAILVIEQTHIVSLEQFKAAKETSKNHNSNSTIK